jgi:hypothetical protein
MSTAVAPQIAVCPEYQHLLESCQRALVTWQQRRTRVERTALPDRRVHEGLKRLQENYARAYASLDSHEHSCQRCQYIAKIGGLDFESMSNALDRRGRFS